MCSVWSSAFFGNQAVPVLITGIAAATTATGFLFHNRVVSKDEKLFTGLINFEVEPDINFPALTLANDTDHVKALRNALDAIGGINRFIKTGERVTIKPNVVMAHRKTAPSAFTRPEFLTGLLSALVSAVLSSPL